MAKKTSRKGGLSDDVNRLLVKLILETADTLRKQSGDYKKRGLPNILIRDRALKEAVRLCNKHTESLVSAHLSRMIPVVLGGESGGDIRAREPIITGLDLPEWFAVPTTREVGGTAGWKRDRDVTPNELARVIEHRREEIIGRQFEMNKIVLLRETALEQGCDPDMPIATVFDDDDDPGARPGSGAGDGLSP